MVINAGASRELNITLLTILLLMRSVMYTSSQ